MRYSVLLILILFSITMYNSCIIDDECDDQRREQLLRFGQYPIQIDAPNDTLSIGDSIRFSISLPNTLYDSISQNQIKIDDIEIGCYVTRDTSELGDTSLINIFDEHFDIVINQGKKLDPYRFSLEENNSAFTLDFYYICKKKMKYLIPIRFDKIIVNGLNTDCMLGDTRTWNAKITIDSDFNTFNAQGEFSNYFGFVVQ